MHPPLFWWGGELNLQPNFEKKEGGGEGGAWQDLNF